MVLFVFFANYQFNKAQPETFLIPNDFRGEIVVFYDENCGQPDVEENGRRIYQISKYGVLITRFTENNGFLDRKFYLVDGDGNKTEIPEFQRQNFETEKKEWRLFQRSQVEGFTKETVGAFWAYGADTYRLSRNSLGYIVSDYHYFERDEKERSFDRKEFTRKADQLLKECRRSE